MICISVSTSGEGVEPAHSDDLSFFASTGRVGRLI